MRSGTCIKCGSNEVYMTRDGAQYSIGIKNGRPIMEFQNYLCTECGYHYGMPVEARIGLLTDEDSFDLWSGEIGPVDAL